MENIMKKLLCIIALMSLVTTAYAVDLSQEARETNEELQFDLKGFEKDLDVAIERAGMSTDLYFACSSKGNEATEDLIQSIKKTAKKLPVDNSDQIAANLEKSYRGIFNCDANIKNALQMGFTNSEIQKAIERSEERKTNPSGSSSFDLEAFERDLEETLSNM
jgi:hypothetical protein